MPRIAGINIPENKQIEFSLTYIYGIGRALSRKILAEAKIPNNKLAKDLEQQEVAALKEIVEKRHKVEGDLKRSLMMSIKRLKDIGSYRGYRHAKRLTCRGQTTRINSRTVRGNVRRTAGSGRKAAPTPT
ncbi:MAG: 30S ribosomal protein S13 [Candidatus Paceibacterota bacterium]|jgi:small subunit ribosomal protein S13|nr:30S ribosomal protein S13 [Candidatus Paceibacterota bacterium]MDD4831119.1 30S ribosomal protein S13 [Candidatus Paceibacterota bacterium]MDD4874997.1 30S ribosomal protein S13 [Candidatus Paceibacterota bacterium]